MVFLENQHRSEANGSLARTSDVDTDALGLLEDLISAVAVKGKESSLSFTSQVLDFSRILLGKTFELSVKIISHLGGVVDQIQTLNFLNDGTEEDSTSWVSHPGVELTVWFVGTELGVSEVVTGGLGLLGEGDHVGRSVEVPMFVGPEFTSGAYTCLNFVDDEKDVVFLSERSETAEEGG